MIEITINGQKVQTEEGKTILQVAEKAGIKIPTLCNHKALMPYGACRLCVVEVSDTSGRPAAIQTSCTYPVSPNLVVNTDTEKVIKTRKIIIELLLARCPEVIQIKNMASELGVEKTRFKLKNNDCTLCGLCVRMCNERMGQSVLCFTGRGYTREVKTPYSEPSEICQVCGACAFICPTGKIKLPEITAKKISKIPSEHNMGLISRSSVFIPFPQAVPNKATIDSKFCVHLLKDKCGICEVICEANAINYKQKEKEIELNVGSLIISPGFETFNAKLKSEYGYGRYPNVLTALEFERILSASGPYDGQILRPYDLKHPHKIAWIQCVGSRDYERNYCSSVCCMYATKEAIIAKEHAGADLQCDIYFMDLRAFGKGFDEYYERAKELGVNYIRCRPSSVEEIPETKNLKISYLTDDGKLAINEYDIVVLSTGLQSSQIARDLAGKMGIQLNDFNFCKTSEFAPVETSKEGIFACGPFVEPKDIPETVMEASGAAAKALTLLSDVKGTLITPKEFPPETDVTGLEPRIGVFVCHCGTNIAGVVNVDEVANYAKTLSNVVYAEHNMYTCSNDTQEKIKKLIKEYSLNRIVVASCSPRTHEPLFRNTIREAGLNPYLFEMANIRDQCSWVHMSMPESATKKSKDLVRMAVAKSRLLEPLYRNKIKIDKRILIIGGGVAGMTTALEFAKQNLEVYLVEKEKDLGGNLRNIYYTLEANSKTTPQEFLNNLVESVKKDKNIHLFVNSKIKKIDGFIGNFETTIETSDNKEEKVKHGIVIVATGATEYKPKEYLYGEDNRVLTQIKLEEKIVKNELDNTNSIVMIQCVGSRDKERPYCSRICCQEAIKNALKIKEKNPDINIYVLYRDVRTYGFKEAFYTKAREAGIVFIRYDENKKPEVKKEGDTISVTVFDPILNENIRLTPDLLVLSSAVIPNPDNDEIGQMLKVPLNQHKFFLEAHMKLRPVDFATEGVFLAGLAHSPKLISETIVQSYAAVARANTVLKDEMELEACISNVIDENCDGCAYCVDPCPYKALTLIEYMYKGSIKKTVQADPTACKGCGVCQATCPKKGIVINGFKLEQISAMVDAALSPGG